MGRPPKKTPAAEIPPWDDKPQTTAVTNWDEELARQAQVAAAMEKNTGGGNFFSTKGGILSLNDVAFPGNTVAGIITDSILENVFYENAYDPESVEPPMCYAFGRDEAEMAPHPDVVAKGQAQHPTCKGCPMNQFNTADKGKGKACGNRRRLGVIAAGDYDAKKDEFTFWKDPAQFETGPIVLLKVSPTSTYPGKKNTAEVNAKTFSAYVKSVASAFSRPPHGIFTQIKLVPDIRVQHRLEFTPISKVPNNLIAVVMKRHEETKGVIEQPYNLEREEEVEKPRGRGAVKNVRPEVKKPKKY